MTPDRSPSHSVAKRQSHSVAKRQSHSVAKRQRLELLTGILGFFIVASFASAVVAIARGEPSATSSLVLSGTVVLFTLTIRARRRA